MGVTLRTSLTDTMINMIHDDCENSTLPKQVASKKHNLPNKSSRMTPPHRKADKRGWLVGVVSLVIVGAIFIVIYALPTITLMNAISGDKISQEDRYYHINQLLEEIDYRNVGTIVHETPYDKVTRSLSPVHFEATFQDPQSFNILKTRILAAVEVECGYSDISLVCRQGRPSVSLSLEKDNTVKLTLNDSGTGR